MTLRGTITLDGQKVDDGFMWAMVTTDGLLRPCSYQRVVIDDGRYRLTVASAAETSGCGAPGTQVTLGLFTDGRYLSEQALPWPSAAGDATFDVTFSSARPSGTAPSDAAVFGTHFEGRLLDAEGEPLGPGTQIEAFIGDVRCGAFSVPPVKMIFDDTQGYTMNIASPEAVPGCTKDGAIRFHVNGKDTGMSGVNDLIERNNPLDLRER